MGPESIGLIGLGLLGNAMAERLLSARFSVIGHDIDAKRCRLLAGMGGQVAEGPAAVAAACDRIVLSLPTTDIVESVVREMEAVLRPGHIIVDTTTGDPQRTAELASQLISRQVYYLDATVSGSSEQARRRDIIMMVGGEHRVFRACRDLFECLAARFFHVGPSGSGARMKLVTNLVMGLNRAALAEGLAFARAIGLEPEETLRILEASMAYSRVMDTKGEKMIREDYRPQARLSQHMKDVHLILDAARSAGIPMPLSEAHRRLLEAAEAAGFGDADNSAIIRAYEGEGSVRRDPSPPPG